MKKQNGHRPLSLHCDVRADLTLGPWCRFLLPGVRGGRQKADDLSGKAGNYPRISQFNTSELQIMDYIFESRAIHSAFARDIDVNSNRIDKAARRTTGQIVNFHQR